MIIHLGHISKFSVFADIACIQHQGAVKEIVMNEENVRALANNIYAAINARDIDAAEQLFDPQYVSHTAGTIGGVRKSLTTLFTAYPEIRFEVEDVLVEGDKFVLRMTIHGVPVAPNRQQPTAIEFFRAEDRRVVEVWTAGSGLPRLPST